MSEILKDLKGHGEKLRDDSDVLIPTEYTFQKKLVGIKIAVIVAFVLSFLALAVAGYLYQTLSGEKQGRQALQSSQIVLKNNAEVLSDKVTQYQVIIDKLRDQVQNYAGERKGLQKELERNQIEISNLEKKLIAVEDRNRAIEEQMASLAAAAVAEEPIEEPYAFDEFETSQDFVSSPEDDAYTETFAPPPGREPQVLTLNRKFNFVVVNLGLRDGIKLGEEMAVYQGRVNVGRIEIEKLYDKFSAATILEENGVGIEEGNVIRN